MFQSITPRPGKVAFHLEPFPAPPLHLLPTTTEESLGLPADQAPPSSFEENFPLEREAQLPEQSAEVIPFTPFILASESAQEAAPRELTPLAQLVSDLLAEEDGPEDTEEEDPEVRPIEFLTSPFQLSPEDEEAIENGVEVLSETFFPEAGHEFSRTPQDVQNVQVEVLAASSKAQVWQMPKGDGSSSKKKSARFGAFFRER